MVVTMEVMPMTTPAMAGARKLIWDFIEEMMSDMMSFSLSFTLWISLM